ncbi:MAG: glycosyltransferase [Lachnospiraceae bacterium]|nr:glycosyltransferase [Lachnospiraceae bacterium]
MDSIILTVIIPVYNVEKTIRRTLESVLIQAFDGLEILIINDGSTDGTERIINEFKKNDGRIRIITIPNSGVSYARQLGLDEARGKYIVYIDGDDYAEPHMLENLLNLVKGGEYQAGVCSFVVEDGLKQTHVSLGTELHEIEAKALLKKYLKREFSAGLWCWIFEKSLFENFKFPRECPMSEDFSAIVYVLTSISVIGVSNYIGYHYIQNRGSLSRQGYTSQHINFFNNIQNLKKQIISIYPDLEKEVIILFIIEEMGLITAMCRNKNYDNEMIEKVVGQIKRSFKVIMVSRDLPLLYKLCAICIIVNRRFFIFGYNFVFSVVKIDMNGYNKTLGNRKDKR